MSSANYAADRLDAALAERETELGLYAALSSAAPDDTQIQEAQMAAHVQMGKLAVAAGRLRRARSELDTAGTIAMTLRSIDPGNTAWKQSLARARIARAQVARLRGDFADARRSLDAADSIVVNQLQQDGENLTWRLDLQESAALERAALLLARKEDIAAKDVLQQSRQRLEGIAKDRTAVFRSLRYRVWNAMLRAELAARQENSDALRSNLQEIVASTSAYREPLDNDTTCQLASARSTLSHIETMPDFRACESKVSAELRSHSIDSGVAR